MSRAVCPVHVARIGKTAVRFFRPPSGWLEAPWVAANDICNAARLSPDMKRTMLPKAGDAKTVATSAGPVAVLSHELAQSIIGATDDRTLQSIFDGAADAARAKMMAGLSSGELFDSLIKSARADQRSVLR